MGREGTRFLDDLFYPVSTGGYSAIAILECGGCGQKFVAELQGDYSGKSLWPLPGTAAPEDLPPKVAEAYSDVRLALAAGSKIGALMAGRTTLIRMLRDKEASSFKDLEEKRIITHALYGGADQLRLWADIIGHEDVTVDAFTDKEVEDVLDYLKTVLEQVYSHQARVNRFASKTAQMKKNNNPNPGQVEQKEEAKKVVKQTKQEQEEEARKVARQTHLEKMDISTPRPAGRG